MADFGLVNDVSMGELLAAGQRDDFDVFLLGGDMAYDLVGKLKCSSVSTLNGDVNETEVPCLWLFLCGRRPHWISDRLVSSQPSPQQHTNESRVGNTFMNTLQPLVASKPFMAGANCGICAQKLKM